VSKIRKNRCFFILIFLFFICSTFSFSSGAKTGAISLGTSTFKRGSDLPACEDDAQHMADVLYQEGIVNEKIEPLVGPNRKKIIEYKIKREAKALEEGDTLIIFNSSHGSKVNGIVTFDGYISDQELSEWISESKCSKVLLINDSCFSGKFELNLPDKEVCQINSSSAPMVSFVSEVDTFGYWNVRNSVFTKYLVEAMRPSNSDKNGDGNATAGEILDYIKDKILNEETVEWRKEEDATYPTLEDAKGAMDKALENWRAAKRRGDTAAMDTIEDEYWNARRAYERKVLRVEMRWQSPTITGDPNFIVVGPKSWKLCMEEKIKANKFSCEVVTTVIPDKATGKHIFEEIQSWIKRNKFNDKVIFLDHLPEEELKQTLLKSNCVVIPSYSEGFCYAAAECISMGIPVIVSGKAALKEVVSGKYIVMNEITSAGLKESLEKAYNNEWVKKPVKKFFLDDTVNNYLSVYSDLSAL